MPFTAVVTGDHHNALTIWEIGKDDATWRTAPSPDRFENDSRPPTKVG
jgi:hypothetical protein